MVDPVPIFTVGHSTRPLDEFVEILRSAGVSRLVDVRSIPRSRRNPQYNLDTLPDALANMQIGHMIIPELGGRRSRQKGIAVDVNGYWRNQSFHNYADYAMSAQFRVGLDRLIATSASARCAIMCAEAVWWQCHRRIIADHLLFRGHAVFHLMAAGHMEEAKPTPGAIRADDMVVYPGDEAERDQGELPF